MREIYVVIKEDTLDRGIPKNIFPVASFEHWWDAQDLIDILVDQELDEWEPEVLYYTLFTRRDNRYRRGMVTRLRDRDGFHCVDYYVEVIELY